MSDQREPGPDSEPEQAPDQAQRHHSGPGARWRAFTHTPFFPAAVLVLIVAAAAGLFAGSYTYAMADPAPHDIPAAVIGHAQDRQQTRAFVDGLEKALGSSLKLRHYRTFEEAKRAVDDQQIFTVLRQSERGRIDMDISSASGASVAEVLQQAAPKVGRKVGVEVVIRDLKPLGKGDPRGLTVFYITLAADIIGFIGAIQLNVNAAGLSRRAKIFTIAAYSLLGGFVIAVMVSWLLDAVPLPFVHSWLILALTMFTSGMVFLMFNTFFGRWAMIPTWLLMVLLGNPSSGGAVSWPLLPSALGAVGRWLPPGASVNAQHTAIYFPGSEHVLPYVVLAAWAAIATTVFLTLDERLRGGATAGTPSEAEPA
ncbi:ABC transporter permease [Streptomyces albidus (ex Kaewkla and Franco 2022)]|uniref:ABC transporter permease n=1 Tax=Streptomyces albidus (ex Kaewkla and Franco 2022) TaxID=722709 RepID=UPI001F18BC9E|nr:ABC transporter permease [Streptomyces albidus (ex Kaewkla and Franco 2022)]